ncbi:cell division protein ZapC [Photobacterium kishitanii]|uniref:Cell division protein ZapC n=1 Tax=Photobacterium kishitanii TaxID=318456 RepID=A0A2T3KJA8_9GAMM|nr:cell division protein ZapC [Photobacterium kishitanii]PSU93179.1 cell division protein ZapC [Photobacterium kishitanii]PSU99606.1 cell division protein ZapC [Photobacterium kishitanii]PSV07671.1 cell division protein ZapC [Photobacterium kishitanii]
MLTPNNYWYWQFDVETKVLMLDLGNELLFCVSIPSKQLIAETMSISKQVFTVADVAAYQTFKEGMVGLPLSEARKSELALNAVAAYRFQKPLMAKSWFFTPQIGLNPHWGEVVILKTAYGCARFVVVENDGNSSLCMLADVTPIKLDNNKMLSFSDTIRVMNNRMSSYSGSMPMDFALVG